MKYIVNTCVFVAFLGLMLLINIFTPDSEISLSERRNLTQFPELNTKTLFDGSFNNNFEKYSSDQFVLRDELRKGKELFEFNVLRKNDVNDLFILDGMVFKNEFVLNEKSVLNTTRKMKNIENKYLDDSNTIYYAIVPDKNYYLDDSYLKLDYEKIEEIMSSNLAYNYIDILDTLDIDSYYLTDTHWKQETLGNTVTKISEAMNISNRLDMDYKKEKILDFCGVYCGQLLSQKSRDELVIVKNETIINSKVYNVETEKYTDVYDLSKINSNDKYDVYLSGATPLLVIDNPDYEGDDTLVVFRDSFGSSLVPLLIPAYKTIYVVDTRYISSKLIGDYVDFKNADVLFIYSTMILNNSSTLK